MSRLVPKLRFEEFSGEWKENEETIKIISGNNYPLDSYDDREGTLLIQGLNINPNKLILDKPIYISNSSRVDNHIIIKKDDILIGLNRPIVDNKLKICLFDGEEAFLYQRAGILDFDKKKLLNLFLYSYLSSSVFLKQLLLELVGSDQPYIKSDLFKKTKNIFPTPKEQQKIANTLSSLDSLIEAQNKKIAALKQHKKALMQGLFPREGESVPRLRFEEFGGVWREKRLGDICDYWNGGSHESAIVANGKYNLISLNSLDINGNLKSKMKEISYNDNSLQKNDLVMVLSDVAYGDFLGLTAVIPNNNFILNQRMAGLRVKDCNLINISFLRMFINYNQKYFKQKGQGSSQLNLSKSSVTDFLVYSPDIKEQQKIANTLSSLDSLIEAQNKKIAALKQHKKGLMQGMFVSGEVGV